MPLLFCILKFDNFVTDIFPYFLFAVLFFMQTGQIRNRSIFKPGIMRYQKGSLQFVKIPLKCTVKIILCFIKYVTFNTFHITYESQHNKSYWENMKGQCAKVTCTGRWCNPALTTYVSSCGSLLQLSAYGAQRNLFCLEPGSSCFIY